MLYRLAEHARDMDSIIAQWGVMQERASKYTFVTSLSLAKAVGSIADAVRDGNAYIIDGYLVLVDVVSPWFSEDRLLQEWYVMKVYPGGSVDSIPPALLHIAKGKACTVVMTADSSPVNIMADAYVRAGFTKLTQSFCTKVPNGICT